MVIFFDVVAFRLSNLVTALKEASYLRNILAALKFHVNIFTGPGVMNIFVYKGFD